MKNGYNSHRDLPLVGTCRHRCRYRISHRTHVLRRKEISKMLTACLIVPPLLEVTLSGMIFGYTPFDWMALLTALILEIMPVAVCC